ncbi:IclR family transcriptional regulator [Microvirga brassicacearum]|uniref:IclR family transcriptional regulator n=1 Tax=Microvirga brassicacearum TaxID=2580413 RepID=A0A5N3PI95_9HYPH|nr:IclR family transcriptional regulator [Microvirga brassicacearum]KAB0269460.1 IclR family transcriptional regulator [Microvirga brassicacearum]
MARAALDIEAREGGGVIAVERALAVLDVFTVGDQSLALAELARRVALSKPTVLRLAKSLARSGYLVRNDDTTWRLGPKLARLGMLYQSGFQIGDYVQPLLRRLSQATGESAAFYVREADMRVCLFRVDSPQSIGHHARTGDMLPLNRGAPGHVLLAFGGQQGDLYEKIRQDFAYATYGERDPEVSSLACPVFRIGQQLVGVLAVTGPTSRFDEAAVARHLEPLKTIANELTRQLGGKTDNQNSTHRPPIDARRAPA